MRWMITGANGFIGRRLAEHLREQGDEVVGVDIAADPGAGVVAGDISAAGPVAAPGRGLRRRRPHRGDGRNAHRRVPLLGRQRARHAGSRWRRRATPAADRFLHISSVVTFGLDFPDGVDETRPVAPTGVAYVDTKIASEQVVLQAHAAGEQEVTIVRPGDVYGPASRPWTVMPVELMQAGKFALPANGKGIHSPIYVDDLVEGIAAAGRAPHASGRVITLSGGVGVPTREYFAPLAEAAGVKLRCLPTPDRARGRPRPPCGGASPRPPERADPGRGRLPGRAPRHLRDRAWRRSCSAGSRRSDSPKAWAARSPGSANPGSSSHEIVSSVLA